MQQIAFLQDTSSTRGTRLADHVADAIVQAAKKYLRQSNGCLAIACDVLDIGFFQTSLWVEGRVLEKHHSTYFGHLEVPEDQHFKALFEVWLLDSRYHISSGGIPLLAHLPCEIL